MSNAMTVEKTFFTSPEHQARFLEIVPSLGKVWPEQAGQFDPEYAAALYVLTEDDATWGVVKKYVSRTGIDFSAMLDEIDFSSGFLVLMHLAGHLFNSRNQTIEPIAFLRLDDTNFQIALTALQMRRTGFCPPAPEGEARQGND